MKRWGVLAGLLALAAWSVWSYYAGGLLHVLVAAPPDGGSRLDALRAYVDAWGAFAPIVYVAAVIVEVLVAPIPGTLLYAPAGAIFGGLVGGTLSLVGNVVGAAIACWIAGTFGERWRARRNQRTTLARYQARLSERGAWIVFLLRVNPLTSSDLVSYAAGLAGVRPHQVAVGTVFGMAPLCYAQAYLAQSLFEWLSAGVLAAIGSGLILALAAVLIWRRRKGTAVPFMPSPRP